MSQDLIQNLFPNLFFICTLGTMFLHLLHFFFQLQTQTSFYYSTKCYLSYVWSMRVIHIHLLILSESSGFFPQSKTMKCIIALSCVVCAGLPCNVLVTCLGWTLPLTQWPNALHHHKITLITIILWRWLQNSAFCASQTAKTYGLFPGIFAVISQNKCGTINVFDI